MAPKLCSTETHSFSVVYVVFAGVCTDVMSVIDKKKHVVSCLTAIFWASFGALCRATHVLVKSQSS